MYRITCYKTRKDGITLRLNYRDYETTVELEAHLRALLDSPNLFHSSFVVNTQSSSTGAGFFCTINQDDSTFLTYAAELTKLGVNFLAGRLNQDIIDARRTSESL